MVHIPQYNSKNISVTGHKPAAISIARKVLDSPSCPEGSEVDLHFLNLFGNRTVAVQIPGLLPMIVHNKRQEYPDLHGRGAKKQRRRRL